MNRVLGGLIVCLLATDVYARTEQPHTIYIPRSISAYPFLIDQYGVDLAKKNCGQNPKNTIYAFKRFMGSNITDVIVQEEKNNVPYKIIADENNKTMFEVEFMNEIKQFYPEQISAMILENLKNCASKFLGYEVKKAVVTVPAYFNDAQRGATKNAGIIAGLDIIRIINEPSAAALSYGLNQQGDKKFMVIDTGGGTMDIQMDLGYETVVYNSGAMDGKNPGNIVQGFGLDGSYDKIISPVTPKGNNRPVAGKSVYIPPAGGFMSPY